MESCVLSDGIKRLIPILHTVCLQMYIFNVLHYLTSKKIEKLEVFPQFFRVFEPGVMVISMVFTQQFISCLI